MHRLPLWAPQMQPRSAFVFHTVSLVRSAAASYLQAAASFSRAAALERASSRRRHNGMAAPSSRGGNSTEFGLHSSRLLLGQRQRQRQQRRRRRRSCEIGAPPATTIGSSSSRRRRHSLDSRKWPRARFLSSGSRSVERERRRRRQYLVENLSAARPISEWEGDTMRTRVQTALKQRVASPATTLRALSHKRNERRN